MNPATLQIHNYLHKYYNWKAFKGKVLTFENTFLTPYCTPHSKIIWPIFLGFLVNSQIVNLAINHFLDLKHHGTSTPKMRIHLEMLGLVSLSFFTIVQIVWILK